MKTKKCQKKIINLNKTMKKTDIFKQIISGEKKCDILYQDEHAIVIRDINPQAPTHLLFIPKYYVVNLIDLSSSEKEYNLIFSSFRKFLLWLKTRQIKAYKIVINNGKEVKQEIEHIHIHIMSNYTI